LAESEKLLDGRLGRLLDIGCALGHMGEAARRRGWDVYVTDVSEYAAIEARQQFGLNAFVSGPEKLPVKPEKFNLITMFDVIEHLSHPIDLLKDVRRALSKNGMLHVTTPNAHSWSAKLLGRHWYHLKPDEHLLYFTPETLTSLLERCGLEVVKIKPMPIYMRVNDIFLRLERYWRGGARACRSIAKVLGLGDLRLKIYTGEMQAWARPATLRSVDQPAAEPVGVKDPKALPVAKEQFKDIIDIVCCANCRSDIQLFEESEAICTQCELSYEVVSGVINFSKYAKRTKHKLAGSS
jgi:SAM-dependent methyltransferase